MSSANLRDRTCRSCGAVFPGGPRAWYCPKCRHERRAEACRRHKARKRQGAETRTLGEVYPCVICGQPYVLRGANQRYCPDCAPCAIKEADAAQGLEYYRTRAAAINPARNAKRRATARPCAWCGKLFCDRPHQHYCSDECQKLARLYRQRKADAKRSGRPEPQCVTPKWLDWSEVDWSMSDREIAQMTGRQYKTVWAARKRRRDKRGG